MFIFELLSIFDWITPTKGFVEDFIHDPTPMQSNSWTFFIPYKHGEWSAIEIEQLMDKYGIYHWGSQITNGEFFFSVKLEQAQWAEYVLNRANIPLGSSAGAPRKRKSGEPNFTFWDAIKRDRNKWQKYIEYEIEQQKSDREYYGSRYNGVTEYTRPGILSEIFGIFKW